MRHLKVFYLLILETSKYNNQWAKLIINNGLKIRALRFEL
jgi:hypothetical protein